MTDEHSANDFRQQALDYHEFPRPGKIGVELTTPADSVKDLSLAYSQVWLSRCVKSRRTWITSTSTQPRAIWWRLSQTVRRFLVWVT